MPAKLLIDIPTMNWACTVVLEPGNEYGFGTAKGNRFVLPYGSASENHTRVVQDGEAWYAEDRGSQTGTFVNGQLVQRQELRDQDVLRIGSCEAVFQNPEQRAEANEWSNTQKVAEAKNSLLSNVVGQAQSGTLKHEELERALGLGGGGSIGGSAPTGFATNPAAMPSQPVGAGRGTTQTTDLIWVAQKLAAITLAVLAQPGSRETSYNLMLQQLKEAIQADNGFVMLPDQTNMRWIIRAWIGDSSDWTQYEKSHPLPLTVTNRAFRTARVVSNALDGAIGAPQEEPLNSVSLQQLQVSSYIAVPLMSGQTRRGVLYFDTRNKGKKFSPRDVRLLELAGNFLLDIEDKRS